MPELLARIVRLLRKHQLLQSPTEQVVTGRAWARQPRDRRMLTIARTRMPSPLRSHPLVPVGHGDHLLADSIERAFESRQPFLGGRPGLRSVVRRADLPRGPVVIETGTVELVHATHAPDGVLLLVNGAESSYLDLADPGWLEFEYMQQMVAAIDAVFPHRRPLRAVHLGAAGCALPRALDAGRPGSRQLAVEVDALLAAYVRAWFDLPRAPRLRLRVGDARIAVRGLRAGSQDLVVRDAFAGSEVPDHLRTVEFARLVSRVLRPGGLFLANSADYPPLHHTRREAATLHEVFPHTAVISEPGILRGRRYGNLVLVASPSPLPLAALDRAARSLSPPVTVLVAEDLEQFRRTAQPLRDPPPGGGPPPTSAEW